MAIYFHIHIDAAWLSDSFESYAMRSLQFCRTDFVGPDGGKTEPVNHLTLKLYQTPDYRAAFRQVVAAASAGPQMGGYIEGECVTLDRAIPERPFDASVPTPFIVRMLPLPAGTFRESEFHVAMCAERSDPALLRTLRDMGLLSIYVPKSWGIAIIFTAQGRRREIRELIAALSTYLAAAGGAVRCSIKEERIAHWWASPGHVSMPPVVARTEWSPALRRTSTLLGPDAARLRA